jgi:NAD(P)-dependent dehydrogenase (short-subunit alcohol dehydrogenase family)
MFNNAGVPGGSAKIKDISLEDFERIIGVHLRGVFLGMKHAASVMKRQSSGSIISTASVAGMATGYSSHIYSAAKAAIIHLTRSVAMELGESMVRVNCICPGGIATPNFGRAAGLSQEAAEQLTEMIRPAFAAMQPIRRPGLPEDVAQAALWLASDDSSFINGHALVVDGGMANGRGWSAYQEQVEQLSAFLRLASAEN